MQKLNVYDTAINKVYLVSSEQSLDLSVVKCKCSTVRLCVVKCLL